MAEFRYDLGFLGGGQLARMSIQAAQKMGLRCLSLDPGKETPASQIAHAIQGRLDDPERIAELIRSCSKLTLENEFIWAGAIDFGFTGSGIERLEMVPGLVTLGAIQDKYLQRRVLRHHGTPTPVAVELKGQGEEALEKIGFPMVLKARFGGYDGKGTRYARSIDEFERLKPEWSATPWLAEEFVTFRRELAVMVFISDHGRGCFPTMETVQKDHVCDLVYPANFDASEIALAAVEAFEGKGLYGVELFQLENGDCLVNEIAPRPHNTGHYTLDWGGVSQFEQHVRTVMGFPNAAIGDHLPVCMANLLGVEGDFNLQESLKRAMEDPDVRVHWYGKTEMRAGRKMGHINVVGKHAQETQDLVKKAKAARERFWQN